MAEDFRAKVTAELDTAEAESKLNAFLNEKRKLKIDVEVNQDSAKKMASSIETQKKYVSYRKPRQRNKSRPTTARKQKNRISTCRTLHRSNSFRIS